MPLYKRTTSTALLLGLALAAALLLSACDPLAAVPTGEQPAAAAPLAAVPTGEQPAAAAPLAPASGTPAQQATAAQTTRQLQPAAAPSPGPERSGTASPAASPPSPPAGDVVYANDFDGGLADLYVHAAGCSGGDLVRPTASPTRAGGGALDLRITDCDERAEVGTKDLEAGRDYVIRWSMLVPSDSGREEGYTIVQQTGMQGGFREKDRFDISSCGNPLGSRMTLDDAGLSYRVSFPELGGGERIVMGCEYYDVPLQLDGWMDFQMDVRYSTGADGYLRLWQNGRPVVDYRGNLLHPEFPRVGLWTMGAYVGDPGHGQRHLYLDEFSVQERRD